jgi:hypothetical protein
MIKKSLPSYITTVPSELDQMSSESIIIENNGHEYLIGVDAFLRNPKSQRTFGGTFRSKEYQILTKALLAYTYGEGEHNITPAFSAPINWIEQLREGAGKTTLNSEMLTILKQVVSNIRFKLNSKNEEWKMCKINFASSPQIYSELASVFNSMPTKYKNFALWQLGYGDFQQAVFIDRIVRPDSFHHAEGISGAVSILEKSISQKYGKGIQVSTSEADKAWFDGSMPEIGGINGLRLDIKDLKRNCAEEYIDSLVGQALNKFVKYRDRVKTILLSGGGSKDDIFTSVLKETVEQKGLTVYKLSDLDEKNRYIEDPSFSCVGGLLRSISGFENPIGIDLGNSFLKSGRFIDAR